MSNLLVTDRRFGKLTRWEMLVSLRVCILRLEKILGDLPSRPAGPRPKGGEAGGPRQAFALASRDDLERALASASRAALVLEGDAVVLKGANRTAIPLEIEDPGPSDRRRANSLLLRRAGKSKRP